MRRRSPTTLNTLLYISLSAALGAACNSLAEPPNPSSTSATTGTPPLDFNEDGVFVRCGQGQYICVPSFATECENSWGQSELYLKATCAKTFGGSPEDYSDIKSANISVDDWPQNGQNTVHECEAGWDYNTTSETPIITNAILFHGQGQISEDCGWGEYCEWLDAAQQSGLSVPDDPVCNTGDTEGASEPGPWRCLGSNGLACGLAIVNEENTQICPVESAAGANTDICLIASTEEEASFLCEEYCNGRQGVFDVIDIENSDYLIVEDLNCNVFDALEMERVSDVEAECANSEVFPGDMENATPFGFTASLVTNAGGSAASSGHYGALSYSVDTCSQGECPILISGITLVADEYIGTYLSPSGTPQEYVIEGVSVALLQPSAGVVDESSGRVHFPSSDFHVSVHTGPTSLGGVPIPPIHGQVFAVDQVVGMYRSGILTLNVSYNTIDANASFSITTR
ncbi:MAG: hypothetical protein R3E95_24825 [Thiolinea sp.]